MSEKSEMEKVIEAAPPGVILSGTVDVHKVLHTDKTGAITTHVIMIAKIGDQEIRKEIQPVFLRALAGRGPMGKIMGKMFGAGQELPAGESDG